MTPVSLALLAGGGALAAAWIGTRIPTPDELGEQYGWRYGFTDAKGNVITNTRGGFDGFAPSSDFIPPGPRPTVKLLGNAGQKGYYVVSGKTELPANDLAVAGNSQIPRLYALPNPNFAAYEESLQWHEGYAAGFAAGNRAADNTAGILALISNLISLATKVAGIVAAAL